MVSRFILICSVAASIVMAGCTRPAYRAELNYQSAAGTYRLASGDRLRIIVFGQDSLTNSYAVDGAGKISMPLIGLVDAYGLPTFELERKIEDRLRGGFLREPRVTVEVEAYRPFFILGEVGAAGQYPYINGMTVQNALAVAGGFAPRAQRNWVELTRMVNGELITGAVSPTHPILPGDTITVKERFF